MKKIPLSRGLFALVDDANFATLSRHKWYARKGRNTFYAARRGSSGGSIVYMHRAIIGCPSGLVVDHINGNGLDNRASNLRAASVDQNSQNQKKRRGNLTSRFKGVSFCRLITWRWRATIRHDRETFQIGRFASELEAARAYDAKAAELFGEFARLNFPSPIKQEQQGAAA